MVNKTDVIVPVFNEEDILGEFFRRIQALNLNLNLIFIDNASTDRSLDILESFEDVTIIKHDTNEGYGGSLIDGMSCCRNENIIIIDADCEYPPEAIPDILRTLEAEDVVYASRFRARRSASEANMPYLKMFGNRIISMLFNVLFGQRTTDLYTGCKGFKRHCIEGLAFRRRGFEHVLEFACMVSRRGYRIAEVPVVFEPRSTGSSKMSHVSETLKFLGLLVFMSTVGRWQKVGRPGND